MNLSNKSILITGATGGIGRALAEKLAEKSVKLHLSARNEEELQQLARRLPGSPNIIAADLNKSVDRQHAISALLQANNPIDVVINLVGVSQFSLFEKTDAKSIENLVTTNLLSPMLFTQCLLPTLNPAKAHIVNVGSTLGAIGYPGYSAYCASKFGLRGFTEALAREFEDTPIKVQYIAPRATVTNMNSHTVTIMNTELGNTMDSADYVASQIIKLIETDSDVMNIGWPEKIIIPLNSLFKRLIDKVIKTKLQSIKQFAQENQHV